jgi:hypothetical protein
VSQGSSVHWYRDILISGSNQAERANGQLGIYRQKYWILRVYALQAAAYHINTRYGSSGAHSPVVYIKTGRGGYGEN